MKHFIDKMCKRNNALHEVYARYQFIKQRYRIQKIRNRFSKHAKDLVPCEKVLFKPRPNQVECHIIGSGWSLIDSARIAIRERAYVVGFNYSGLMDLPYDCYFTEFAGPEVTPIALQQQRLLTTKILHTTQNLYFKGLGLPRNDPATAFRMFGEICKFTQDLIVPCLGQRNLPNACKLLMEEDRRYLRQYMSTTLTLIALAVHSGFTKIILHGVDLSGPYFYEDERFNGDRTLVPETIGNFYYKSKTTKDSPHVTNPFGVGVESAIPIIEKMLVSRGIELLAASSISPICRILKPFKL